MTTLKERREADKKRVQAWRKRQSKDGKKNLSVTISEDAHRVLRREKEKTGETNSEVIERALLNLSRS